jgi:hypothetical protein
MSDTKKITIFLASSNELKAERERFELDIYRKCKAWFDKGIFLHLDIWEDGPTAMSLTGTQSAYNDLVKGVDLFVLLVWNKLGMYSAAEFETAFGQFSSTKKPFIFTYFKTPPAAIEASLTELKEKLGQLKHFACDFTDSNDLWNQFNKELESLALADFAENRPEAATGDSVAIVTGDKNVTALQVKDSTLNINIS